MGRYTHETLILPRTPGLEVNIGEACPQSKSPLFHLPVELRQQIYEYVIGTGQVHTILRSCKDSESPIFRTTTRQCTGGNLINHQKLTYSTCRNSSIPSSFQSRYTLSQLPFSIPIMYHNSRGRLPSDPPPEMKGIILPDWRPLHETCYENPQMDMSWQSYASAICSTNTEPPQHLTRPASTFPRGSWPGGGRQTCASCTALREDVERRYGPPTAREGLRTFHADTAVQVNGLLRSCRAIYGEAKYLPFKLYSFDVDVRNLRSMVEVWLEPWQSAAIECLHLSCGQWGELSDATQIISHSMPGLEVLEVDLPYDDGKDPEVGGLANMNIESVEVIAGYDTHWNDKRSDRREWAKRLEVLLGKEI